MAKKFKIDPKAIARFDEICSRGLCGSLTQNQGNGKPPLFCVEAAIFKALNPDVGDDEVSDFNSYVHPYVSEFKIALNDSAWSSPKARAKGLHDLGIAQLGTAGKKEFDNFRNRVAIKLLRLKNPKLSCEAFASFALEKSNDDNLNPCAIIAYRGDKNLNLIAKAAYEVLKELKAPGAVWLDKRKARFRRLSRR